MYVSFTKECPLRHDLHCIPLMSGTTGLRTLVQGAVNILAIGLLLGVRGWG